MENFKKLLGQSSLKNLRRSINLNGYLIREKDPIIVNMGLKKNLTFDQSLFKDKFQRNTQIKLTLDDKFNLTYLPGDNKLKSHDEIWRELNSKFKQGQLIEGRILNTIKGGYSVGIAGLIAFLPQSQMLKVRDDSALVGKLKTFALLKVDKDTRNIIVSRKRAIQIWAKKFPIYTRTLTNRKIKK